MPKAHKPGPRSQLHARRKRTHATGTPDPNWKLPVPTKKDRLRAERLGRRLLNQEYENYRKVEWQRLDGKHPTEDLK